VGHAMRYRIIHQGYSLVEVLTVVAIVSILASIAALSVFEAIRDGTLSRERDTLLANIEEAKARSISSRPSGIRFNAGGTSYETIVMRGNCNANPATLCNADSDCVSPDYCSMGAFQYDGNSSRIHVLNTYNFPSGMIIGWTRQTSASECSNATDVLLWFDRKGVPRCSNWGLGMTTLDLTLSGKTKSVVIDRAGRVKYEN